MSQLRIRKANRHDLPSLVAGNVALAAETEQLRLDETTLSSGISALLDGRAPGDYWVATADDAIVGQLMITFEWSDWRNRMVWWIQSVYVAPERRQSGVFRALYDHVANEARAAGAAGLRLYVDTSNTRAQRVYEAIDMNGDHYRVFEAMFHQPSKD